MRRLATLVCLTLCLIAPSFGAPIQSAAMPVDEDIASLIKNISLPPGFHLSLYTDQVPNARSLSLSPDGILYVGTWNAGKVYAVADTNQDGQADNIWTLATKLNVPNGVAFHNGDLYVAEINRILRFKNIESHLDNPPIPEVIRDDFPTDKAHDWKFIRFGPDGLLYLPVGAPCNICERDDPYASITRMLPDGSGFEIFARGIRNSVGFDWHPHNKNLWFTDNGRDWLGDDIPPDELNHAPQAGLHFGFPLLPRRRPARP
jgi:glucose/arabinose dehydrogenase